jgi:hypothetical protein
MELRMEMDNAFIEDLQGKLGAGDRRLRATDVAREAFTILNWAVHERERGRVILSADPDGQRVERLAMLRLDRIRPLSLAG